MVLVQLIPRYMSSSITEKLYESEKKIEIYHDNTSINTKITRLSYHLIIIVMS